MVDSFTKEKAEQFYQRKSRDSDNNSRPLTVAIWTQKNKFFNALRRKYPSKATQLQAAMINYCNRIMNRLHFQPTYKISDNIQDIIEYIIAVPRFIKNTLIQRSKAVPPFQVDLLIAVNHVIPTVLGANVEDDDEDEEDETKIDVAMDPSIDHIGFVQEHFKKLSPPIYYAPPDGKYEIVEEKNGRMGLGGITRILGDRYKDFRTNLSGNA
eukprot:UN08023